MNRRRARWSRSRGFDTVRIPFGWRSVPRGQGWAEAAKWSLLRFVGQPLLVGAIILLGWFLLLNVLTGMHR